MAKIISIHSFRGGTGKSNTTANVAGQVAMRGKRVGIVDTDIQSPGIHVLFGLNEDSMGKTLNQYLRGECSMSEIAHPTTEMKNSLPGLSKLNDKELFLFPSSIKGSEITKILSDGYDPNMLNQGIKSMIDEMKLDYLFIDTHPGLNEETLLSISVSDILLLILRPDQQDFQGTSVTVDIANMLFVDNLFLLVNKALSKLDFSFLKEQIEGAFGAQVASVLPLSEDLVENASADLFSLANPDHPWSQGIIEVADIILAIA